MNSSVRVCMCVCVHSVLRKDLILYTAIREPDHTGEQSVFGQPFNKATPR